MFQNIVRRVGLSRVVARTDIFQTLPEHFQMEGGKSVGMHYIIPKPCYGLITMVYVIESSSFFQNFKLFLINYDGKYVVFILAGSCKFSICYFTGTTFSIRSKSGFCFVYFNCIFITALNLQKIVTQNRTLNTTNNEHTSLIKPIRAPSVIC